VRYGDVLAPGGAPAPGAAGPGGFQAGEGEDGGPEIYYPEEELVLRADSGGRFAVRSGDTVGRLAKGADLLQYTPTVSRRHLKVEFRDGRWFMRNLSSNGTYVNGSFADEGEELEVKPGDELMLSSRFRLTVDR
jgi:pSer/pThr/pTyr-binding forkhead associated (FHA) protein